MSSDSAAVGRACRSQKRLGHHGTLALGLELAHVVQRHTEMYYPTVRSSRPLQVGT